MIALVVPGCAVPGLAPDGASPGDAQNPWIGSTAIDGRHRVAISFDGLGDADVFLFETRGTEGAAPLLGHFQLDYGTGRSVAEVCSTLHVGRVGTEVIATGGSSSLRTSAAPIEGPVLIPIDGGLVGLVEQHPEDVDPPILLGLDRREGVDPAQVARFEVSSESPFALRLLWKGNMTCLFGFGDFDRGAYTESSLLRSAEGLEHTFTSPGKAIVWPVYRSGLDYEIELTAGSRVAWSDRKATDGASVEKSAPFLAEADVVGVRVPLFRGQGEAFLHVGHIEIPDAFAPYLVRNGVYAPLGGRGLG